MSDYKMTKIDISHAWQAHRTACLELAIKAGATTENLIEEATKISEHIMVPSERENKAREAEQ